MKKETGAPNNEQKLNIKSTYFIRIDVMLAHHNGKKASSCVIYVMEKH